MVEYRLQRRIADNTALRPMDDGDIADEMALGHIITNVSSRCKYLVVGDNIVTAWHAWSNIRETFANQDRVLVLDLSWELTSLKMTKESVAVYFAQAVQLHPRVASAGREVTEPEFLTIVMAGLPTARYGNTVDRTIDWAHDEDHTLTSKPP